MFSEIIDQDMPGYVVSQINSVDVPGLFSREYIETNRIAGNRPILTVLDTVTVARSDLVVVDSNNYVVEELQPDGDGFIELVLSDG